MPGDIGRYQIDYILVKERFRNQVINSKSYPGADIASDHNLVVMNSRLKFKKLAKPTKEGRVDLEKLKVPELLDRFKVESDKQIGNSRETNQVEEIWAEIRTGLGRC